MKPSDTKFSRLFKQKDDVDPRGLKYMSQVDEALNQRGHPYAYLLSMAVLVFFAAFFIWAAIARLDEVTRGEGQVIPADGTNPVQSDRGGRIEKILVKENEVVEQNQLLASIANMQEVSILRDLQNKNIELTLSIIRLEAEAMGTALLFTPEIEERYPEVVRAQRQLYESRKQQFAGEDIQLESQIEQRQSDVIQATNRLQDQSSALAIVQQRERTMAPLVGGSVTKIQHLEVQQEIISLEGEVEAAKQSIPQAERAVREAEETRNARRAERQASIAEELNRSRIEQASVQERMTVSSDQVSNTELRAPITGVVKRIHYKEGGVAKPADTIIELIPLDGVLEIEAKFKPEDRGFLYVSQNAVIKFAGYDFSIYGGLDATIIRISEDTIEDKKGEPWYQVRFVTKKKYLEYQGKALEMHPGMPVTVDVLTDKRTVLDIILRPILRAKDNAMTER